MVGEKPLAQLGEGRILSGKIDVVTSKNAVGIHHNRDMTP